MTGVAIVGVIGSGSAAIAGVVRSEVIGAADSTDVSGVSAPAVGAAVPPSTIVTPGSPIVTTYDVGGAGSVDLAVGAGSLTVEHAVAAEGWSLLEITGDAATVQVRFADAASVVSFVAHLDGGAITTGVERATADGTVTTEPAIEVPAAAPATAATSARPSSTGTAAPASTAPRTTAAPAAAPATAAPATAAPATAAPATAAPSTAAPSTAAATTVPATTPPTASATTAPSGGESSSDDEDDEHDGGDDGAHDDD